MTGIEANPRIPRDVGIVCESLIHKSVADDEWSTLEYRVAAKRVVSKHLANLQTVTRLEPLAVSFHQSDKRDGNIEQRGGKARDTIKALLGRRVPQAKRPGSSEPTVLIVRLWRSHPT